jgi:hypothetical protein
MTLREVAALGLEDRIQKRVSPTSRDLSKRDTYAEAETNMKRTRVT